MSRPVNVNVMAACVQVRGNLRADGIENLAPGVRFPHKIEGVAKSVFVPRKVPIGIEGIGMSVGATKDPSSLSSLDEGGHHARLRHKEAGRDVTAEETLRGTCVKHYA